MRQLGCRKITLQNRNGNEQSTLPTIIVVRKAKIELFITFLIGRVKRQTWHRLKGRIVSFQTVPSLSLNSSYQRSYERFYFGFAYNNYDWQSISKIINLLNHNEIFFGTYPPQAIFRNYPLSHLIIAL